ncbi:phage tail assembly protein [Sphingomonas melonis]|uniref:phage tail assembly protein n=1 Tax=Sphingomonas melonis TaxID=152682 RepID=UPI0035C7D53C
MNATAALASSSSLATVTLDVPLSRGDAEPIATVTVRKPNSGELRGLTLMALAQLDYTTLETLLPRITMPILHKADIARLDPADLMQLGGEVMDFLLPQKAKAAVSPTT